MPRSEQQYKEKRKAATTTTAPGVVLLCVCGLPGSGKSSLCKAFIRETSADRSSNGSPSEASGDEDAPPGPGLTRAPSINSARTRYFDFDEFCNPTHLQRNKTQGEAGEADKLASAEGDDAKEHSEQSWKQQRALVLSQIKEELASSVADANLCIVVADDTFHLRSMRRELYQLAREAEVGFAVVHVATSVGECVARDACRTAGNGRIGAAMIQDMAARFEAPEEPWERRCFLHVDTASAFTLRKADATLNGETNCESLVEHGYEVCSRCPSSQGRVLHTEAQKAHDLPSGVLQQLASLVHEAQASPLRSYEGMLAHKERDREFTAKDAKHRLELALRAHIASLLRTPSLSRDQKKTLGKQLSLAKSAIKQAIIEGTLDLAAALQRLDAMAASV